MVEHYEMSGFARTRSESGTLANEDEDDVDRELPLPSRVHLDSAEEARLDNGVTKKLDFILLPFLALFNLINSLDRSNVGNAETQHFTEDAGLEPGDLNTAVAVFFAVFVIFQPVGATLGRKVGMVRWVPSCMLIWGSCTILHIWVSSKWELILLRVVIGILEAGIYSVMVSYLSLFYTRYEFATRLGVFAGQYPIAGALGGILAYTVFSRFPSGSSYSRRETKSWQVLFILEGGLTIFIALAGFILLPRSAETAWFFTKQEKAWAAERIRRDRNLSTSTYPKLDPAVPSERASLLDTTGHDEQLISHEADRLVGVSHAQNRYDIASTLTQDSGLSRFDIYCAFTDWKIWYLLVFNILSAIPASAFSVFLPLVVEGLGFSAVNANLMTAPPFFIGAITLLGFCWWSDRYKLRITPILYGLGILLVGLFGVVLLPADLFATRYVALCILLGGSFIASPLLFSWLTNNVVSPGKRAVVLGIQGWGNLAGVFSSLLFSPRFGPTYIFPFIITLAMVFLAFTGFFFFRYLLVLENSQRRRLTAEWTAEEIEMEQKWGMGPARRPSTILLKTGLVSSLVKVSAEDAMAASRQGEDRKTYIFGL